MQLQMGDIIWATAASNPLLTHLGIVVVEEDGTVCISHNTPMWKNPYGGNVVVEPVKTFLQDGRRILSVRKSSLQLEDIEYVNDKVKAVPFDILGFNCEQYVYYAETGKKRSPQMQSWMLLTVLSFML